MVSPTSTKFFQLRMGIESGERQQDGVLVFDDIPIGALVHCRVDRPTELVTASLLPTDLQPYRFELAPPPANFTAGGVAFTREAFGAVPPYVPSGAPPSSRNRVLIATGTGGPLTAEQHEPLWAAFAPVQDGSLRQKGKLVHALIMPGQTGATPELPQVERNLLRFRWSASA